MGYFVIISGQPVIYSYNVDKNGGQQNIKILNSAPAASFRIGKPNRRRSLWKEGSNITQHDRVYNMPSTVKACT